jgi:hypothetical protein
VKFIGGINKELPVPSSITLEALEEARLMLNSEPPMLVGGSRRQITPEIVAMIEEWSPFTAVVLIPEPVLSHPNTWFLAGTTIVVFTPGV